MWERYFGQSDGIYQAPFGFRRWLKATLPLELFTEFSAMLVTLSKELFYSFND